MNPSVSVHPLARQEYLDGVVYYLDIDPNVAARFIDAYELAIVEIRRNPKAAPAIISRVRRKLLRKFPYSIFYYFSGGEIRITAVSHQLRKPLYWAGRE